jgi:hypothetical protein
MRISRAVWQRSIERSPWRDMVVIIGTARLADLSVIIICYACFYF